VSVSRRLADAHREQAVIKRATPPNTPNAVDGTSPSTSSPPGGVEEAIETVRLTVRLDPDLDDKLGELDWRLMQYVLGREGYDPEVQTIRTLVLKRETHDFIAEQAKSSKMTINAFLSKILSDERLAPVPPPESPTSAALKAAFPGSPVTATTTNTNVTWTLGGDTHPS
jgi:hypothetical protein